MANKLPSGNLRARYFLGFTTIARPDWGMYVLEPKATKSTLEASVAKEVAAKKAKQEAAAATSPITGTLISAAIVDQKGETVMQFALGNNQPGYVSVQLLEAVDELLRGPGEERMPLVGYDAYNDVQVRLFGFYLRERMKLVALDALHYAAKQPKPVKVPLGLWYHRPFEYGCLLDPMDAIVPSELRGEVDFTCVCDFLGIPVPPAEQWVDPVVQANIARQLALTAQLFPQ